MDIIDDIILHDSGSSVPLKSLRIRAALAIVCTAAAAVIMGYIIFLKWKLIGENENLYLYYHDARAEIGAKHLWYSKLLLGVFIGSCIFFFIWLYGAQKNLTDNKLRYLQFSPGQTVWFFFIPFLNFYFATTALIELHSGSKHLYDKKPVTAPMQRTGAILPTLWIVFHFIPLIISVFELREIHEDIPFYKNYAVLKYEVFTLLSYIITTVIVILYILNITSLQQKVRAYHLSSLK